MDKGRVNKKRGNKLFKLSLIYIKRRRFDKCGRKGIIY